jgi:hypothetical protein
MAQHHHRAARHRHRDWDRQDGGARNSRWPDPSDRTVNAHRSRAESRTGERSENRESRVADRTHNSYRSATSDRTHNSRRSRVAQRSDNTTQTASWSYRGSHRSERKHRADNDRPAGRHGENQHQHERSDGGRHHRGHYGDHNGRG